MLRMTIYKVADQLLPCPEVLRRALDLRHVYKSWTGHELVYVVSLVCPNPEAVKAAIDERKRWHKLVVVGEVAILAAVFLALGYAARHIAGYR